MNAADDHSRDDAIELILPARSDVAQTLRVVAASIGADLGFSLDEIDDVRLALNEVFTSALDAERAQRVSVSFRPGPGRLDVRAGVVGDDAIDLDELATTILRSVVDELDVDGTAVSFTKLARESVG